MRANAPRCPFCDHDLSSAPLDVVPDLGARRLGRAALFAFATSVAALGCNSPQRTDSGNGNIVQPYGAPPTPQPQPIPQTDAGAAIDASVTVADASTAPPADASSGAATDASARDAATDARAQRVRPHPGAPQHGSVEAPQRPSSHGAPMVRYGAPPQLGDDFV